MDEGIRTFLEQFEKRMEKSFDDMEKRLEDRIQGFMAQTKQAGDENNARHRDFRSDIKTLYSRLELNDRKLIGMDKDIKRVEGNLLGFIEAQEKKEDKADEKKHFEWSKAFGIVGMLVGLGSLVAAFLVISS